MKVFKFGGASIKNATAIRNMCEIISTHQSERLIVIVSAMGKSTNALENIHHCVLEHQDYSRQVEELISFHEVIVRELFSDDHLIDSLIEQSKSYFEEALSNRDVSSDQLYDTIVSVGELVSSMIVSNYLNQCGISTLWADARQLIQTNDVFKGAKVDWDSTQKRISEFVSSQKNPQVILTQGFIAATADGLTTTLGREGSDYTGAIFASCLDADSYTVWKDVDGILNADPKRIEDAVLFDELSYDEASEMTYYGAKVIHPNTIKPLANRHIPLYVKCFDQPDASGTKIHNCKVLHAVPAIIFKENQCLVTFKSKDLTFVKEKGISQIFDALDDLSINMNIMQNSAVSFSICIDYQEGKVNRLIDLLKGQFDIRYNSDLELVTIKNYTEEAIDKYRPQGKVLLEQKSRSNYRMLIGGGR